MRPRLPRHDGDAVLAIFARARGLFLNPFFFSGVALLILVLPATGNWQSRVLADPPANGTTDLSFVGTATCAGCHAAEAAAWETSQHAHAMAHATDETVLGDFEDAVFDYFGTQSRFFREDGNYFVETEGADGALDRFEVAYTFGLHPLQQYLVAFPDGRIQALPLAWDSRPKEEGGQRWFHLYPGEEIGHDHPLHWTKLEQNWNFMCAECHSTGVSKNYDAATDRYATTWEEISVGCEACHGKGSGHVAWARGDGGEGDPNMGLAALFDEREGVVWHREPKTGLPERSRRPRDLRVEVEACGRCHGLRAPISEDWTPGQPLADTHLVDLISEGVFQPDGQMEGEVFNYGPFKQSKMYQAGVTCSDCHEPHSGALGAEGEALCLQCHDSRLASDNHTHHEDVAAAARPDCISCHMPARTFMVIDERHDHSFRIPRPDLSAALGTPNACNDCHVDKSPGWAAAAIEDWFGPDRKGSNSYGEAFHRAWEGQPDASARLAAISHDADIPGFVRGSALAEAPPPLTKDVLEAATKGLTDEDPLVRLGALEALSSLSPDQAWRSVSPLLDDPVLGVRMRAGELLAGMPLDPLSPKERDSLRRAQEDFVTAHALNGDRPGWRSRLGDFYVRQGRLEEAESEYGAALRLNPAHAAAAVNLADLYRRRGEDEKAVRVLRQAIAQAPEEGALYHALGLTLIRLGQREAALAALRTAMTLSPDRPRFAYVYAVGLQAEGRVGEAITVLEESLGRHPHDRDTLLLSLTLASEVGALDKALRYAEQLSKIEPDNAQLQRLIEALRSRKR